MTAVRVSRREGARARRWRALLTAGFLIACSATLAAAQVPDTIPADTTAGDTIQVPIPPEGAAPDTLPVDAMAGVSADSAPPFPPMARAGREGWAFIGTFVTIALAVGGLFLALFPDVMPSTTDAAFSLTTTNAAATAYTLKVMTWVAVAFTVLLIVTGLRRRGGGNRQARRCG